ncbi:DUF6152 family protein [Burkholderiaceae bacterium FT117]|uniref:DUF6152 family protein n=1 Tax=Zeimonas sediminis TaxID=2944268 RepID=UPI002342E334|nr:DUF6152 family protein [Zeimonas sediminis]MCM5570978.1 DUF6152 family protein [Zeimonas sediminis]
MHRRRILGLIGSTLGAALAGAAPGSVLAHHGWSSFDPNRPLYLRGRIKAVRWRNPHAEIDLEPAPGLALPGGLESRALPAQVSQFDGKAILAATKLVPRTDVVWTVELAPLTRMQAWGVEPLKEGETVEIVGYTLTDQSEPVLRAEWLFRAGKTYGLRSSPA